MINHAIGYYFIPSLHTGNNVSVINTATNTVSQTIGVGTTPAAIAITPDGTQAYVVNSDDNTVSAINTTTATVPVGSHPNCIAISAPTV